MLETPTITGTGPAAMDEAHNDVGVAYDDLFSALHDGVLRYAYLLVGDRDVAHDLAAEAFARMLVPWRRREVLNPEAYVRRVVLNLVRDRQRRDISRARRERRTAMFEQVPTFEGELTDRSRLGDALAVLPPRQRAVVVLRFYETRSEQEIAHLLGIRLGTVKSTLSRALDRLRLTLGEEDS